MEGEQETKYTPTVYLHSFSFEKDARRRRMSDHGRAESIHQDAPKEDFAVTAQKGKKEPPEYRDVEDSLREAVVEMLIARKAQARVGILQGQPVTAAGQELMAMSDRRRQMLEDRDKFLKDNPRTQACCQYDCRQRTRYHSDMTFVHGGVLRCMVTRVALIIAEDKESASSGQQTTRRVATLVELKSEHHRRREWYDWHGKDKPRVAAHVFRQFELQQHQIEAWEKEEDKKKGTAAERR